MQPVPLFSTSGKSLPIVFLGIQSSDQKYPMMDSMAWVSKVRSFFLKISYSSLNMLQELRRKNTNTNNSWSEIWDNKNSDSLKSLISSYYTGSKLLLEM